LIDWLVVCSIRFQLTWLVIADFVPADTFPLSLATKASAEQDDA
jgi:hypothetical protein